MAKLGEHARRHRSLLIGWALLAVLYIALSGSIEAAALVAAVVCASAGIAIAFPLLATAPEPRRMGHSLRLDARIAGILGRDCIAVARASFLALRAGLTRRELGSGVFRERHLAGNARADIVALVLSLAPNSYVVDTRGQDERIVFHHLIAPDDDDPSQEAWPPGARGG